MTKFLIGSDPEVGALLNTTGELVEAAKYFKADKEHKITLAEGICDFHVDNVNLELNIKPAASLSEWMHSNSIALTALKNEVSKQNLSLDYRSCVSYTYDFEYMQSVVFGCEADYNAWTGKINVMHPPENPFFRSRGGHIHIGLNKAYSKPLKCLLIQTIEVLTAPILAKYETNDDKFRRILYGKPGAMRFKPYGVEYRVPGPQWLYKPELQEELYPEIDKAVTEFLNAVETKTVPDLVEFTKVNRQKTEELLTETH